jgi:hypothetical protein
VSREQKEEKGGEQGGAEKREEGSATLPANRATTLPFMLHFGSDEFTIMGVKREAHNHIALVGSGREQLGSERQRLSQGKERRGVLRSLANRATTLPFMLHFGSDEFTIMGVKREAHNHIALVGSGREQLGSERQRLSRAKRGKRPYSIHSISSFFSSCRCRSGLCWLGTKLCCCLNLSAAVVPAHCSLP